MTAASLILLCALADRIRGGWAPFGYRPLPLEYAAKFGYGVLLAALAGVDWHWWAAISVLWWLGEKPGWGYPWGWAIEGRPPETWKPDANPEIWQVFGLEDRPYLSLAVRGGLWGAPCLLVVGWCPDAVKLLSYAIVMPLAAYMGHVLREFRLGPLFIRWDGWAVGETLRGLLGGTLIWLIP